MNIFKWLEKNYGEDTLKKFQNNLVKPNPKFDPKGFDAVLDAFVWAETPEKDVFWYNVNTDWQDTFRKYEKVPKTKGCTGCIFIREKGNICTLIDCREFIIVEKAK